MRTLLLFRGAPGCGKSTYIKEHNLEQYVLSADTLRLMCQSAQETPAGQMEISPQNDDVVWEMLFKLLEVRMSHGEFTVIDATNSKTVEMNRYKNLAKQYRYRMYVIDMTDLPIEECKRRNAQREWLKRVPEAAIDKMYARFATQKVPSGVTVLPSTTDVMSDLNYCPNDFNQWKKIHVIGDVHGCYTCLSEYLGEMKDDELYIFVGDYLDRGIENVEVFKFLCDVVNNNRKNVILLEGNHERWLNKWGHEDGLDVAMEKLRRCAADAMQAPDLEVADIDGSKDAVEVGKEFRKQQLNFIKRVRAQTLGRIGATSQPVNVLAEQGVQNKVQLIMQQVSQQSFERRRRR